MILKILGIILGFVLISGSIPISNSDEIENFSSSSVEISHSSTSVDSSEINIPMINVDWVYFYNVENITNASSDIIVGKVISIDNSEYGLIPTTSFKIDVENVIKGNLTNNDVIIQKQLGSISKTAPIIIQEKLMNIGETYLFFLSYYESEKIYTSTGGPQGRMMIIDSKLYSLDNFDNDLSWIPLKVNSESLISYNSKVSDSMKDEVKP